VKKTEIIQSNHTYVTPKKKRKMSQKDKRREKDNHNVWRSDKGGRSQREKKKHTYREDRKSQVLKCEGERSRMDKGVIPQGEQQGKGRYNIIQACRWIE